MLRYVFLAFSVIFSFKILGYSLNEIVLGHIQSDLNEIKLSKRNPVVSASKFSFFRSYVFSTPNVNGSPIYAGIQWIFGGLYNDYYLCLADGSPPIKYEKSFRRIKYHQNWGDVLTSLLTLGMVDTSQPPTYTGYVYTVSLDNEINTNNLNKNGSTTIFAKVVQGNSCSNYVTLAYEYEFMVNVTGLDFLKNKQGATNSSQEDK